MNDHNVERDRAALNSLIMGYRTTQLVYVAAKLGLADLLADGAKSISALAERTHTNPGALYRLMRTLASLGIFKETKDGLFALTPLAESLKSKAEGSLHSLAIMFGEEWIWRAYGRMIDAVRTGEPAFPRVHGGATLYEYLKTHEDAASVFHAAMSGFSGVEIDAVLAVYDFSSATAAVDVGGAHGAFLAAVMKKYPRLNGIVFDLEAAAEGASKTLREAGLADRARFVSGDFFHSVPEGGDIYILKSVLHNWNGEAAAVILRNCRAATADSARLLVIERIIPPGNQPSEAKLFDINMMVTAGGQERTEDEYASLLSGVGFNVMRVIPTQAAVSVIEAMSADRA